VARYPFARNCEEVIAYLREILAGIKAAKKAADDAGEGGVTERRIPVTRSSGAVVALLGSPQMENQGFAVGSTFGLNQKVPSGQNRARPPKKGKTGDPMLDRLTFAYDLAMFKCKVKHDKANEAFYRCLARNKGNTAACKSKFIQMQCPEGVAAREALDTYVKNKGKFRTGDGGGGGW